MSTTVPYGDFRQMMHDAAFVLQGLKGRRRTFTRRGHTPVTVTVHDKQVFKEHAEAIEARLKRAGLLPTHYQAPW